MEHLLEVIIRKVKSIFNNIDKKGNKFESGTPGPGAYNVKENYNGPKFSIGGVKDNEELFKGRHESPGPGTYNFKDEVDNRIEGGRFSSSKRPEDKPTLDPGPGAYNQTMYNLSPGPSFSLKGKVPDKKPESSPGPGHYFPKHIPKKKRRFYLYRKNKKQKTMN